MRKQQLATIPNATTTNLCPVIQTKNQSNIDTNRVIDKNQINYPSMSLQVTTQNSCLFSEKGISFARYFLLYNSWILTNKCITSNMRHHSALKNDVLQHRVDQNFLREIKGGLKGRNIRTTAIDIWVKCMPPCKNDFATIQQWDSQLSTYKVKWNEYASTLSNIKLTEEFYMTDALNKFIIENYSTISMFIEVSNFIKTKNTYYKTKC